MLDKNEDRENRQNQLIDAATTLFFSKGYTNTSVRDILDEANDRTSSPSVFYYYFDFFTGENSFGFVTIFTTEVLI